MIEQFSCEEKQDICTNSSGSESSCSTSSSSGEFILEESLIRNSLSDTVGSSRNVAGGRISEIEPSIDQYLLLDSKESEQITHLTQLHQNQDPSTLEQLIFDINDLALPPE